MVPCAGIDTHAWDQGEAIQDRPGLKSIMVPGAALFAHSFDAGVSPKTLPETGPKIRTTPVSPIAMLPPLIDNPAIAAQAVLRLHRYTMPSSLCHQCTRHINQ